MRHVVRGPSAGLCLGRCRPAARAVVGLCSQTIKRACKHNSVHTETSEVSPGTMESTDLLRKRFVIPASEAKHHIDGLDKKGLHKFLMSLVEPASELARPPISKFCVGAVGLASSGAIYVGVNLEFPGVHLNNSIHAEQCLLANCMLHGEHGIKVLAVSEAPCGHCRQFYSEIDDVEKLRFVFGAGSHWLHAHPQSDPGNGTATDSTARPIAAYSIDQLLPARFGPQDLMTDGEKFPLLLAPRHNHVQLTAAATQQIQAAKAEGDALFVEAAERAHHWAQKSYSPYTKSFSGAAIITTGGKVYSGAYIESCAYNPSLTPFHSAWVHAVTDNIPGFDQIARVVLAQLPNAPVQHQEGIQTLLRHLSPRATVATLDLEPTKE